MYYILLIINYIYVINIIINILYYISIIGHMSIALNAFIACSICLYDIDYMIYTYTVYHTVYNILYDIVYYIQ